MIFMTLGSQKFQFNRLVKRLDLCLEERGIEWTDDIFGQVGLSGYVPRHFPWKDFLNREEFDEKLRSCDLLLTHAGVGTIISGLSLGKKILVCPRLQKYKEVVDDHQLSIAEVFSKGNHLMVCQETDPLWEKIEECQAHEFTPYVSNRERVVQVIEENLKKWGCP